MASMRECGRNALNEFHYRRPKLFSYGSTRVYDLVANRNQDIRTAFGQAQRRDAVRLKKSAFSNSSAADAASNMLTSTISTASQIFRRTLPAMSNPGTGAKCKKPTPVKSASWPMRAAVPRALPMASIARYRACVLEKKGKRNGRTERVWIYSFVCSTGITRLRFEAFHQVDAGAIALSPLNSWPPSAAGRCALVPVADCGAGRVVGMTG